MYCVQKRKTHLNPMSKIKITINDQEIESLDKAIKLIQEAKEQEKKGLWRPRSCELYYYIDSLNIIRAISNYNNEDAEMLSSVGNCFRTASEAQAELGRRKALTRIKDYIARERIEREKDWFDGDTFYSLIRSWGFSAEDTEKIIQACESDLKILFGIK